MTKLFVDRMRHLICVPYSIRDLHAMARNLKINRHWFHRDHYDVPKRRIGEINEIAIVVSPKVIARLIKSYHSPARPPDYEVKLLEKYKKQGKDKAHLCPSLCGMATHDKSQEFVACQCDKDSLQYTEEGYNDR